MVSKFNKASFKIWREDFHCGCNSSYKFWRTKILVQIHYIYNNADKKHDPVGGFQFMRNTGSCYWC